MNDSNNNTRRGVVNGQTGTWVPVETGRVPDNISTDPNKPSVGADNSYYFATPFASNAPDPYNPYGYQQPYGGPRPISANMNNAIPTPSSIVQLPPIVQPISLVPYASQNQPLVQYDPNVRPDVPETKTPEPVYRKRPFIGLSIVTIIFTLIALVVGCLIPMEKYALMNVVNLVQKGEVVSLLNGDMDVLSLLALIFLIAAVVLAFVLQKVEIAYCISGIAMAAIMLVLMIIVAFGNREALVMDYIASKQTFLMR